MLKEDQAAALLARCEAAVGKRLTQVRGNLRQPGTRAAALWELLVIDAAACLGGVEYEPEPGGSPDVRLHLPQARLVWLEAAFLEPRFWEEDRKSHQVSLWISEELRRRGIPLGRIHYRFEGSRNEAGYTLRLPDLQQRKEFLKDPGLVAFLEAIQAEPTQERSCVPGEYSIAIHYTPTGEGPYAFSSGPVLEAPRDVRQHALYRLLVEKARQHDVDLPHVVCVGSDRSPALSLMAAPGPRGRDAINALFGRSGELSAVIVVRIESERDAQGEIFTNPNARTPLSDPEIEALRRLNFNRWRYTFPLQQWKAEEGQDWIRRVWGKLVFRWLGGVSVEIEIPGSILVDILAGKTTLAKEYRLSQDDPQLRVLRDGWGVEDCKFKPGDIRAGEAPTVILRLAAIPPIYSLREPKKAGGG